MIVIADDITGAAEIAGIAHSKGQTVQLLCGGSVSGSSVATTGTTVMATDTRSMTEAEAVAETQRIASLLTPSLKSSECGSESSLLLFKKTDSALRGHVVAELKALMEATGCRRTVYLPANPSKGRVIRGGVYYIDNTPIHETAFSYDPEFPAKTSILRERFPDAEACGIVMPDAESEEDIRRVVARYDDGQTLFAGAADLFSILLEVRGQRSEVRECPQTQQEGCPLTAVSTLILCGSTQSKPLNLGIPVSPMPLAVYDGSDDISLWDTSAYDMAHSLILTMPYTHRTGKAAAVHLRSVMAQKAKALVASHRPDHLVIEGGATAWLTLQTLGWTRFEVVCQVAPGVVQMRAESGTVVTLKPGSYPWGGLMGQNKK